MPVHYGTTMMWLLSVHPLPIRPNGGNKRDVRRILTILGVQTANKRNRRPLPCHWTMLGSAVGSP